MTMQSHILRAAGAVANAGQSFANYTEFQAYISSIVPTLTSPANGTRFDNALGLRRLGGSWAINNPYGTSWGSFVTGDSFLSGGVVHGMPSRSVYDQLGANNAQVLCQINAIGTNSPFLSLTRNGVTSISFATPFAACTMTRLIYWDFSLNAPFEMNPHLMQGPFPYEGE